MRLLHICDSIIGGTGSYLAELVLQQAKDTEIEGIHLLIPQQHMGYLDPRLLSSRVAITTFDRRKRLFGMIVLFYAYLKLWLRIRPDIVHSHSFGAGLITRLLPVWGSRLVYCPHGWSFNMRVHPAIQTTLGLLERVLALRSDAIILISRHEVESAAARGIPKRKMWLVLSGIEALPPAVTAARWDDHRVKLLFVGRFDRQKGLDLLLAAAGQLRDRVCLRLIGAPIVGASHPLPVPADFVEQVGWLDREDVAAHMRACDAIVIPSRWEGFGLVAVEAMRVGKPVIASAVGGLKEILDDGRYGFSFPPNDARALKTVLANLTPESLEDMAKVGHQRFRDCYTSDRMVQQTFDVYRDVMPRLKEAVSAGQARNVPQNLLDTQS